MAIPTVEGAASAQTNSGTTVTVDISTIDGGAAPSVGDLLLAVCTIDGSLGTVNEHIRITSSEGKWHRVNNCHNFSRSGMFYKFRESGDDNTVDFVSLIGSSEQIIAGIICVRGVDTAQPIARYSQNLITDDVPVCLAETTPVADCLALAWYTVDDDIWGTETPPAGWTEHIDTITNDSGMYAFSQGFASASTSTGTAALSDQGAGTDGIVGRMIVLQPPQPINAKDVRTKAGSFLSATATGNQDITGFGFDVKALILWTTAADAGPNANATYSHGIGADDGVTGVQQRYVGAWHTSGGVNEAGYSGIGEILKVYQSANSTLASPNSSAVYSKITDGFRLNWATAEGTARRVHYIAFGGADFRATVISEAGNTSPVTGLPWRPHAAHVVSQCLNSNADQIRTTAGLVSLGWIDFQSGGSWCVAMNTNDGNQPQFTFRDSAFMGQVDAGALTYELIYRQTTSDGWTWTNSNADFFFALCMNFDAAGTGTTFPFDVSFDESDASGTNGADQTLPVFNAGKTIQARHVAMTQNGTDIDSAAASYSLGWVNSDLTQYVVGIGKTGNVSEKEWIADHALVSGTAGDLNTTAKQGSFTSKDAIDWSINNSTYYMLGLFTIGQGLDPNAQQKPIFFGCNF